MKSKMFPNITHNVNNKDSMKELDDIVSKALEGNYLISAAKEMKMKSEILALFNVVDSEEGTELPVSTIPEFATDEWIDCCEQLFGGMRKSR